MTLNDKQLLLADLCGRLPYGVMVKVEGEKYFNETKEPYITNLSLNNYILDYDNITITPYLRPLSSITDEETEELRRLGGILAHNYQRNTIAICAFAPEAYDWFNKHHFDFRGLIPMGLALEAPDGMYK